MCNNLRIERRLSLSVIVGMTSLSDGFETTSVSQSVDTSVCAVCISEPSMLEQDPPPCGSFNALSEMCIAAGGQPVVAAVAHNWICLQALSTMNIVAQVVVAAGEHKRVLLAE
ncbi:hypothetical protein Tco_0355308 [Tanacetum coccineum]